MERPRAAARLACLLAVGAALVALATPAAAQSVNRAAIDDLNTQLLYVALPLTLFVELTLVYAIYRFRDNDDPEPTVDDPALETTWTAATAVILVFVGVSAYFVLLNPYITPAAAADDSRAADPADDVAVEVVAYQWGYEFTYTGENVTSRERLVLPVDRDIRFTMSSRDVVHSLFIPKLAVKQDIFPTHETVALTRPTRTGEYRYHCAEFCGAGHARMSGTVAVVDRSTYEDWLTRKGNAPANASVPVTPSPGAT